MLDLLFSYIPTNPLSILNGGGAGEQQYDGQHKAGGAEGSGSEGEKGVQFRQAVENFLTLLAVV
jgi:hypothetical protein